MFSLEVLTHKRTHALNSDTSVVPSAAAVPPAGHLLQHPIATFVLHHMQPHSNNFNCNFSEPLEEK